MDPPSTTVSRQLAERRTPSALPLKSADATPALPTSEEDLPRNLCRHVSRPFVTHFDVAIGRP